jgi:two-component system OmpR family sensor kinase
MQQTAFALRAGLPVDAKGRPQGTPPEDENNEFIVQVWTNEGLRIFESALGDALPQMAVLGFADVPARGTTYRVFSLQTRSQVIQIAQDMRVRQMLAREAAWRSLLPVVLLLPLLALAVWWVIRRSLTPVQRVRRELALRQPQDLAPVAEHDLPDEMRPLVEELNSLLQRVRQALRPSRISWQMLRMSCARRWPRCSCNCSCCAKRRTALSASQRRPVWRKDRARQATGGAVAGIGQAGSQAAD